jgi:hypothetical protein
MYNDLYLQFESKEQSLGVLFDAVEVPATKEVEVTVYLVRDEDGDTSIVESLPEEMPTGVEVLDQWVETRTEVDDENTVTEYRPKYNNIDVIGLIYKPTGEMTTTTEDGLETPVMEPIDGWHVNVRLTPNESATDLIAFSVEPTTPVRVWG